MRSDVDVVVSLYSPLTNDERFALPTLLAGIGSSLSMWVVIGSIGQQVVCLLREAQIPGDAVACIHSTKIYVYSWWYVRLYLQL